MNTRVWEEGGEHRIEHGKGLDRVEDRREGAGAAADKEEGAGTNYIPCTCGEGGGGDSHTWEVGGCQAGGGGQREGEDTQLEAG